MPFGAAINCSHFQWFSNAIAHLVKFRTKRDLVNYLDDFLFAALMRLICNRQLQTFLDICSKVKFPVSMEKTHWVTNLITFLGFLIDTMRQLVMVPIEKLNKAKEMITKMMESKHSKATVLQIQKVAGFLNFLCRCVIPGRAFTRRLYALTANSNLKQHHHVRLSQEVKLDLKMWLEFLEHPSVYARPFLDYAKTLVTEQIDWYTDSSGKIGFGGIYQEFWFHGLWSQSFLKKHNPSIEYLELYALTVSLHLWLKYFRNSRIILFCDNQSVVVMINNTTSSCKQCLVLLRKCILHCMKLNVRVFAWYVKSAENTRSDLLSRNKIEQFKRHLKHKPTTEMVPENLWPLDKLWLK